MVLSFGKIFHFTAQRRSEQENVRIINEDTGLNIIRD
jgi:hypothetical protein